VDYQIARRLAAKPFARSVGGGVSDAARRLFDRMQSWASGEFTSKDVVDHGEASKSSVYGWIAELYTAGALEQTEAPRGRSPARWRLTGRTPDVGESSLPTVEDVFPEVRAGWNSGDNAQPSCPSGTWVSVVAVGHNRKQGQQE